MPNHNFIDLMGQTFGRLTVIGYAGKDKRGNAMWECVCECLTIATVKGSYLRSKHTTSCGCLYLDSVTTHGECTKRSHTREYSAWFAMRQRCLNPKTKHYNRYGGRGITICERWGKYENFLEDMDRCPPGLTLDRIDNNGNYEKTNCRWVSRKVQANNRECSIISIPKFLSPSRVPP